ncbi:MAG: PEP/pyruvate-binding domain-containing protein [Pseudomonadota bacterium]
MRLIACVALTLSLAGPLPAAETRGEGHERAAQYREWIVEMKGRDRGPFERIRWFCTDGSVLPPEPYACKEHGGGRQHGEWTDKTVQMREDNFLVGNVLIEIAPADVLTSEDWLLQQLLLEQFLIAVDDGWILRKARYYGGAFQVEAEVAAATNILEALLMDEDWLENRLLLIMEAARLLPHGTPSSALTKIRADAAALEDLDPGFEPLRNKIHSRPDISDAAMVREYASTSGDPELAETYEALAAAIETEADPARTGSRLRQLSRRASNDTLWSQLVAVSRTLQESTDAWSRVEAASHELTELRALLPSLPDSADRLVALDAMIAIAQGAFVDTQGIAPRLATAPRRQQLQWLVTLARIAYGTADLTAYEWQQLQATAKLADKDTLALDEYRDVLAALTRAPSWVQRRQALHMELAIEHYAQIEPLAREYIPDRLRSSPMLMYSAMLEALTADANALAGLRHSFFGQTVATGLRSLNPGTARGVLLSEADYLEDPRPGTPKILLVPETLADLPPVAGILTENEGNHLSHVQLLARNLGIPNVVIGPSLRASLEAYRGKPISLSSTPGGVVRLYSISEQTFAMTLSQREARPEGRIVVDLAKLDLDAAALTPVAQLRADDSGVRVGPKAAKLGELMYRYPQAVSAGLAIPFGAFRDVLDQPFGDDAGTSAFEWLRGQYAELAAIDDPAERETRRNAMLQRIRQWFLDVELDPDFVTALRDAMQETFGPESTYGVFVRSDTNVEDLPGFTGAGLNLTVPNVVGFDETLQAIRRVWASPFSERAYGWRQALMDKPEHLYAAVLLHKSVNADLSGVMVTQNVDTGSRDAVTIVINEGVGGGVEGQSAETIVAATNTGNVRLASSATAPLRRVLLDGGGSELVPTTGAARLLSDDHVADLLALVADVNTWFETDAGGEPLAADVEFGFAGDNLVLFQIRPFVENRGASANAELLAIDAPLRTLQNKSVKLAEPPAPR